MVWTLISYSEIRVPLRPFKSGYFTGLAEDENKRRLIVQVDIGKTRDKEISVGATGKVISVKMFGSSINLFVPFL